MSRIGNKIITVPAGVTLEIANDNTVTVTGAKGTLTRTFSPLITITNQDGVISLTRANEEKHTKQLHGTTRALLANMIEGVSKGYKIELEIQGIGYRAALQGSKLVLTVGYSHQVEFVPEEGVKIEVPAATQIVVSGIDKQRVGEWAANIRATRKPDAYKGKGIRYKGEVVHLKEGKTAGKK